MDDIWHMLRALVLAARGQGHVEPNPMVGCVIVRDDQVVGEGWHQRYGGPHAEVQALKSAGRQARGATLYVSLEPCCHHGKTPPCTQAILAAGIKRVVVAVEDPFAQVAGKGLAELRAAGVETDVGVLGDDARKLLAPYLKLVKHGRPWVIAKWAMTLDGKIATSSGESRWVSGPESREVVHQLRGRMDGILVGQRTAVLDDPLLTARPAGARVAARVVLDSSAQLPVTSQLVKTINEAPVIVAVSDHAPHDRQQALRDAGCEVLVLPGPSHAERLENLLAELGRRRWTNLLVEGGGQVLGSLFDADQVDEVHVFIAAKVIGGEGAPGPVGGHGLLDMAQARSLVDAQHEISGADLYLHGRLAALSRQSLRGYCS